jgi:succinyldiaminopimelate transaminase
VIAPLASGLPDFPWDRLEPAHALARSHPDGEIDLSIGTPVDETPHVIQKALAEHSNAPGYPTAAGIPQLREAWSRWSARTLGVTVNSDEVAPLVGSKELVALLPFALGLRAGTVVAIPELAYPTYAVGAMISGADFVTYRSAQDIPDNVSLVWVNTPGNPTGAVLDDRELLAILERGRALGAPVVSDECYLELGWDVEPVSILKVAGPSHVGALSVQSLSKRSNLAGYRSGAVLGDAALVSAIVGMRKHAGLLMPTPVQHASIAALDDDAHVLVQKERYRARREILKRDLTAAGFDISHSEAGLYLWATRGENCMATIEWLAQRGIVAAPGDFYGPAGANHIRIALTVTDEQVAQVASRLG